MARIPTDAIEELIDNVDNNTEASTKRRKPQSPPASRDAFLLYDVVDGELVVHDVCTKMDTFVKAVDEHKGCGIRKIVVPPSR